MDKLIGLILALEDSDLGTKASTDLTKNNMLAVKLHGEPYVQMVLDIIAEAKLKIVDGVVNAKANRKELADRANVKAYRSQGQTFWREQQLLMPGVIHTSKGKIQYTDY